MGLPLFITPIEPEAVHKPKEPVASTARSSIRRQRTVRGPHARILADHRRRRALQMWENEPLIQDEWGASRLTSRLPLNLNDSSSEHMSIDRQDNGPSQTPPIPDSEGVATNDADRRDSLSNALAQDGALVIDQGMIFREPDGPLMPAVPESRDFARRLEDRQRQTAINRESRARERLARRRTVPPPPYTGDDRINIDGESQRDPNNVRRVRINGHWRDFDAPSTDLLEAQRHITDRMALTLSESELARLRYQFYQEQDLRLAAQARLDGLGDRERSLSPPEGESIWETLLTSITPDPQPPSAGSSFASSSAAAAASSTSSSSSIHQSLTSSMTSVSRGEDSTNNDCDGPESEVDSDEEEWMDHAAEMPALLVEPRSPRTASRTYADITAGPSDNLMRRATEFNTANLRNTHRAIARLAQRDEIPDIWWARAGLSRTVRQERSS